MSAGTASVAAGGRGDVSSHRGGQKQVCSPACADGAFPCYCLSYYLFVSRPGKSMLLLVQLPLDHPRSSRKPTCKETGTPNNPKPGHAPSLCRTSEARSSQQHPRETPPAAGRAECLRTKVQPFSQTPNSRKMWPWLSGIKAIFGTATINGEEPIISKRLTLPLSRG